MATPAEELIAAVNEDDAVRVAELHRRGPDPGVVTGPRRRVGDHALALSIQPGHDRCVAGRRSGARRLRGDGARVHRSPPGTADGGSRRRRRRSRRTGSPRCITRGSSARSRRRVSSSPPARPSTSTRRTRSPTSRCMPPLPAATWRSAACCSGRAPTSTPRSTAGTRHCTRPPRAATSSSPSCSCRRVPMRPFGSDAAETPAETAEAAGHHDLAARIREVAEAR